MPAAAPPARILEDFLDVYALAELQIARQLAASVERGTATPDQLAAALESNRLRARIDQIVRKLVAAIATAGASMLLDAVIEGGRTAIADLAVLLGGKGSDYASPINQGALDNLARSLSDKLTPAHLSITRVVDDAYKQIIGRAAVGVLTGTQTRREIAQVALNEFAARGITGFTDSRGRNWELSSYAEMAARSTTARAAVDAHIDRLAAEGFDLVYVSDSPQECPLCRPWEGKVLSIAGAGGPGTVTTEHPLTGESVAVEIAGSVAFARAAGLLHPNCTHSLSAYLHGATRLPKATENPQGYEDRQKLRYLERGVRKAKRVQAVAMTPAAKKAADARVRAWQGRIRDHVKATGLIRQRAREQVMVGKADQATGLTGDRPDVRVHAKATREQAPALEAAPRALPAADPKPMTAAELRSDYADKVTPTGPQRSAIDDYAGGTYVGINDYLRFGPTWVNEDWAPEYVRNLDALLLRYRTPRPVRVQRAVHESALPAGLQLGQVFTGTGYQSTSIGGGADGFDEHPAVLDILVPSGMNAVVVEATGITVRPGENELLLPHGTRYVVQADEMKEGRRWLTVTALPPE